MKDFDWEKVVNAFNVGVSWIGIDYLDSIQARFTHEPRVIQECVTVFIPAGVFTSTKEICNHPDTEIFYNGHQLK